jgi:putative flippase GtrA
MTAAPVATPGEAKRFASFIVTGGIAAAVNLASRWALSLAIRYEIAVAIAYVIGMTTAFMLARRYVFDRSGNAWHRDYLRFAMVNAMSFLVVLGVSVGLARYGLPAIGMTWHTEDVAHLIGVVSPIVLSYYAHKYFSFAKG